MMRTDTVSRQTKMDSRMTSRTPPQNCNSMSELRREIDAIDEALIDLFALRTTYIDRAVDLKRIEGLPARTVDRVAEVLAKVRKKAADASFDEDLAEAIWKELIEWSIRREIVHLGDA